MFQVNNTNTRKNCEICSKLTIKTQELRQSRRSCVFIVNFEHISHVNEQVNVSWLVMLPLRTIKSIIILNTTLTNMEKLVI